MLATGFHIFQLDLLDTVEYTVFISWWCDVYSKHRCLREVQTFKNQFKKKTFGHRRQFIFWGFYLSPLTCHLLHFTCHPLPVIRHLSPITRHPSPVTRHLSPVTRHLSPVTDLAQMSESTYRGLRGVGGTSALLWSALREASPTKNQNVNFFQKRGRGSTPKLTFNKIYFLRNQQKIKNRFQKAYILRVEGVGVKANLEKVYISFFFWDASLIVFIW